MIRTVASIIVFALLAVQARAELTTASIFSHHMVVQRGIPTPVWGWANPGVEVTVAFAGQEKKAVANAAGRWEAKLDALEANAEGQAMVITGADGKSITLNDILIGDVWICSGQSNMEWSVRASHDPAGETAKANHPQIRLFNVEGHDIAPAPAEKLRRASSWRVCSPQTIPNFSAVGYYFGRELQQKSQVPIGLLGTNWGGTRIEPWTPPEGFRSQPELAGLAKHIDAQLTTTESGKKAWNQYADEVAAWSGAVKNCIEKGTTLPVMPVSPGPKNHGEPAAIFNAMVAPIVGYGVRGAIWYQGESNSGEGLGYLPKLKALVEGWRTIWQQPEEFPFYFYVVKLAQFHNPNPNPEGGDGFARIRIAQDRIQELPHTGVASAIDIGEARDIHPKNKQDVGKRLAQWALRDVHGKEDVVVSGPTFKSMTVEGNKAVLSFDHIGGGLITGNKESTNPVVETPETPGAQVEHFAIAGADKKWHWARAEIVGEQIHVSAEAVAEPVAVRFAYTGNPDKFNLYNKAGLPAIPFRTDEW